jgi:hypothetical protein
LVNFCSEGLRGLKKRQEKLFNQPNGRDLRHWRPILLGCQIDHSHNWPVAGEWTFAWMWYVIGSGDKRRYSQLNFAIMQHLMVTAQVLRKCPELLLQHKLFAQNGFFSVSFD